MEKKRRLQPGFLSLRSFFAFAVVCSAGMLALLSLAGTPSRAADSKIAPWVFEQTANGGQAEFLIVMVDQADLGGAGALRTKPEKTRFVRDALWEKAQATQRLALDWLRERNIEHRSYYIVNLIWAKAGLDVVQALAARPDVARIEGNPEIRQNLPEPALESRADRPDADNIETPAGIEHGINHTRAPEVWAMGNTGQGIVVGNADCGVRWDHNALKSKYRGWNGTTADHNFNWHDSIHSGPGPCFPNSPEPCDGVGHGSHTMGTMVGDDGAGNQIGMAPGAKWISCRALNSEGIGTEATILECFEFFLAPYPVSGTPEQGDPEKAPDVVLYSFGGPAGLDIFRPAIAAHRAAGIMPVAGAGNSGSCGAVNNLVPGRYDESYTVGALNTGTDFIANFSSRGPAFSGAHPLLKPDLTAPGTDVRSSYNNSTTAYQFQSSTGMAAAHVAGGVALLWSAYPSLRGNILDTERFLNHAAFDILSSQCGSGPNPVSPNYTFGYGRLDVKAAVAAGLVVTTIADHNDGTCSLTNCTLREAINAANAGVGDDIIRFAPGVMGTIQLTSALPNLSSNILVQGPGANVLAVRRNTGGDYRIFTASNGTSTGPTVDIAGLTIANGRAAAGAFPVNSGGGILNDRGTLTLSACTLSGNMGDPAESLGGGIFNHEGTLVVENSTLTGNNASYGAGICNYEDTASSGGVVTVRSTTFTANTAAYGGAIYTQTLFSGGNSVSSSLTNCTLSGNSASVGGGAMYNTAATSGTASTSLTDCTLSGNSAPDGGGIYNYASGANGTVYLRNNILKTGASGVNVVNNGGTVSSSGNNLTNDNTGFTSNTGDIRNTDPMLGPLASNGGLTQTHALLSGSPAINAGTSVLAPILDQRGYSYAGANDIGAYEFNGVPPGVQLLGAASRKVHGGAGTFDIALPLTGSPGIECRTGGASNDYQVVLTFAAAVTFNSASITSGTGSVSSASGSGTTTVTVNLTGVTNAQRITITLAGLSNGSSTGDLGVPMGVLVGDTTGNGSVTASDIGQTKAASGQAVSGSNFRLDVTASGGSINASDIGLVKANSGTVLP